VSPSVTCTHQLVLPFVHFVMFVHAVMFSKLDAVVHCTQLSLVLVVLTTCINTLVPPVVHV
jgi:hypothetical protein